MAVLVADERVGRAAGHPPVGGERDRLFHDRLRRVAEESHGAIAAAWSARSAFSCLSEARSMT